QLFGQLGGAGGGGVQCLFDEGFETTGLEGLDGGFGGAVGRGDPAAQFGGVHIALGGHARRAQGGLQGQLRGGLARQAELLAGGGHRLDEQEEIGRATAGHGGDRVDQLLLLQPQGHADRRQQLLGLGALGG